MTSVVAILTCHNRVALTERALASFFASVIVGASLSAVLLDDGSTDGTADRVRERFARAQVIDGTGEMFWAAGMAAAEQGAERLDPDYVLWLNDDVLLYPDTLSRLVEAAQASGDRCLVVGQTEFPAGSGQVTYGAIHRSGWHPMRYHLIKAGQSHLQPTSVHGNILLVSRLARRLIGPIDGKFAHGYADWDYGHRATTAGVAIVLSQVGGECEFNPGLVELLDPDVSLSRRLALLASPKGNPLRDQARYLRRHGGPLWPVFVIGPYLQAVLDSLPRRRATVRR